MSDEKVDLAVLKTLLAGLKEKLGELYKGQADFLKEWPAYVSKLATLEQRIGAQEKALKEHIEAGEKRWKDYVESQRWSWGNLIAVLSLVATIALVAREWLK